jgi:hypothetical protein
MFPYFQKVFVAFVPLWDTNHAQNYTGHSIKPTVNSVLSHVGFLGQVKFLKSGIAPQKKF